MLTPAFQHIIHIQKCIFNKSVTPNSSVGGHNNQPWNFILRPSPQKYRVQCCLVEFVEDGVGQTHQLQMRYEMAHHDAGASVPDQ